MTAATLLAARQQALAQAEASLTQLDAQRQQLVQGILRLQGAVEALQALVAAADTPDVSAVVLGDDRAAAPSVGRADTWDPASPAALPWERA